MLVEPLEEPPQKIIILGSVGTDNIFINSSSDSTFDTTVDCDKTFNTTVDKGTEELDTSLKDIAGPSTLLSDDRESDDINIPNISNLLDATLVGRAIKSIYKIEKQLDSRCQSYVTDIIVQHFVNAVPFK